MNETSIPDGHIQISGHRYVALELFEAANQHVLEQGTYCNQLIGTLNDQAATIAQLREERDRSARELDQARAALARCKGEQAAMRKAVHRAAGGL